MTLDLGPVNVEKAGPGDPFAEQGKNIWTFDVLFTEKSDWDNFVGWLARSCKGHYIVSPHYRSLEGALFHKIYKRSGPLYCGKGKVIFYRKADAVLTKTFFAF